MKISRPAFNFILLVFIFISMDQIATAQKNPGHETVKKWFEAKHWDSHVKLTLNPAVDTTEFYKQYHAQEPLWDKVFIFLKETDLKALAPGKYPIDGDNAYAMITEAASKEPEQAKWEAHQTYIDLQHVITGEEQIGVAHLSAAKVTNAYDAAKDYANYTVEGVYYTATPEMYFLFFPHDVHRPGMKVPGYDTVKKLVIKIKAAY